MTDAIETNGLVKTFGDTRALDGVDLAHPARAPSTACSARTAPARPPPSASSPRSSGPTPAPRRVLGHDVVREAATVRQKVSLTGQYASVDEDLTGHENLVLVGRLLGLAVARRAAARRRAARGLRPRRGRGAAGADLLRRHAAPHRHRGQPGRDPRDPVPRRADHRSRSAQPQPGVGAGAPHRGRGDHRAAHHAVPRRGRSARRAHGRDRSRPRDRRGHEPRAQGVGRLERAARAARQRGPARRARRSWSRACWATACCRSTDPTR